MSRQLFFTTVIALVVVVGGVFFAVQYQQNQKSEQETALNPIPPEYPVIVAESVAAVEPQIQEVFSPDGSKKFVMKKEDKQNNEKFYSFVVADQDGNNEQEIFTKMVSLGTELVIPDNSWSPDNKYVFIQEKTGNETTAFVFNTSGEPFANEEQYLDVTALFAQKETGYTFDIATGWADPTLLIVNTKKEDGTKGPSYWFVIYSKGFLQLAQ